MRVLSGFNAFEKRLERESERRKSESGFIPYLRLADDGDMIRFRIVSEHESEKASQIGAGSHLISAVFHRHSAMSSKGQPYYTNTMCSMEETEDGELVGQCSLCDSEIARATQFLVWAWAYEGYHIRQNSDVNNPWKMGKMGEMPVYVEPMNKFMVWQDGFYSSQSLKGRLQIYGSITDRDYIRTRRGVRKSQQVRYELDGLDPTPMSPEIFERSKSLPDLMGVADGTIKNLGGESEKSVENSPVKKYVEVAIVTEVTENNVDDLPF